MKKPAPRFTGKIEAVGSELKVAIGNPERYRDYLRKLGAGKRVWITIETEVNKRSLSQNNYYWMYLSLVADETGDDPISLHEYLKRTLLPPKFVKALGKELKIPQSTTDLSKADFGEYLEKICALTNVPLPNPEDAGFIRN